MLLKADELLERRKTALIQLRSKCKHIPVLALIWVGTDVQTAKFVAAKQKAAKELDCELNVHHFQSIEERQLEATIQSIASKKSIDGIILQLPLANNINTDRMISLIPPHLDVDGLLPNSNYSCPTPLGIIQLLNEHNINLSQLSTVIIGNGRLVGAPLSKMFKQNNWPFTQINANAQSKTDEIIKADVVISCTGESNLITPNMVSEKQIIVDGSGVDVDVKTIEPLVTAVTPSKGAIGPLTVSNLLENLINSALRV